MRRLGMLSFAAEDMMLQAGWLIVNLIAGALTAPEAVMQPSGISCTYQACMMKCGKLNSPICNSYCEAKVAQRVAARICPLAKADDQDSHSRILTLETPRLYQAARH